MNANQIGTDDGDAAIKEFKKAVNMTPKKLTAWLATAESKKVGFKASEGSESVGHDSGKKIVKLLEKPQADFTEADVAHARKVVGYIHRHLAQRPEGEAGDISRTPWRYSLMNWGHDPQTSRKSHA